MPRKQRDHKAEYAAAKQRATRAGYRSQREYKATRKALSVPRNASPIPKRIAETQSPGVTSNASNYSNRMSRMRRESRNWSRLHSRSKSSKYDPRMSDETVERYHTAFVESLSGLSRRERGREKRRRAKEWLVPEWMDQQEWEGKYPKYGA